MEIKYQTVLKNNLVIRPTTGQLAGSKFLITEPLTINEIVNLEAIYNNGHVFPVSLRELLFLAGKKCHALDYGLSDTREEMQEDIREELIDLDREMTTRPFFVIDVHRSWNFFFVYLDEEEDDPMVYAVGVPYYSTSLKIEVMESKMSLSSFINDRISDLQRGVSPF